MNVSDMATRHVLSVLRRVQTSCLVESIHAVRIYQYNANAEIKISMDCQLKKYRDHVHLLRMFYCGGLENDTFRGRPADFCWFLFSTGIMLLVR